MKLNKFWIMMIGRQSAVKAPDEQECEDAWFNELFKAMLLNGFSESSIATLDTEAWRENYFRKDYTPCEALLEDLDNV